MYVALVAARSNESFDRHFDDGIYGPSSVPYGEYYGITEMPEAVNIEIPEIPLP